MIRHLKKAHFIDFTINNVIAKRIKKEIIIDVIIFYNVEINIKTKEKRKKKFINRDFDKIILKYLFLRWIIFTNLSFKIIKYEAFRTYIKYVNFVVNRMLSDFDFIIKIYIECLFVKGK